MRTSLTLETKTGRVCLCFPMDLIEIVEEVEGGSRIILRDGKGSYWVTATFDEVCDLIHKVT